jgi:hypothetical protein
MRQESGFQNERDYLSKRQKHGMNWLCNGNKSNTSPASFLFRLACGGDSTCARCALYHWYSIFFVRVPPDVISLQLCTPKVVGT